MYSVICNLNRAEYTDLAKPYSAQRMGLIIGPVIISVLSMLMPTLLLGGVLTYSTYTSPPAPTAGLVTNILLSHLWPYFLCFQILTILSSSMRLWSILSRRQSLIKALFPDSLRRETVTTLIAPYGVVQASAGSTIITPWGNIVRIDEIPEAFVLQVKNQYAAGWPAWIDVVYIPKPGNPSISLEISIDLLKQFQHNAATSPNYLWHVDLVPTGDKPVAAETVWPPAPEVPESNIDLGIPLTGNIYLPMLQARCDGVKLSFRNGPLLRMINAQGSFSVPFILFINFYHYFIGSEIYWGIAAALALSAALFAVGWYSGPLLIIDRQKSQVTIKGIRFATMLEIQAIAVLDTPAIYITRPARKPVFISISKTTGKPQRLPILAFSSPYETNIIAMILGQFLTESKYPPNS